MKIIILFTSLFFALTSCFKDRPYTEFSKVAGSWKIEEVIIETFDSIGNSIQQQTFVDRGYYLLTYSEDSYQLAENSFGQSINSGDTVFNSSSLISFLLGGCDRWDVSVNAKHINFGVLDPLSLATTQIIALSIPKLDSKHMHWSKIERNSNGSIARMELFKLIRSN